MILSHEKFKAFNCNRKNCVNNVFLKKRPILNWQLAPLQHHFSQLNNKSGHILSQFSINSQFSTFYNF
jgi:hypothetical protein